MKKPLQSFFCFFRSTGRVSNLTLVEDSTLNSSIGITYRVEETFVNSNDDLVTRCYFVSNEHDVAVSVFSALKSFIKKNFPDRKDESK